MAAFIAEMRRNRIELNESLQTFVALVKNDPGLLPDLIAQLATAETLPAGMIPYLIAALNEPSSALRKTQAVVVLSKNDSKEGCLASLGVLGGLDESKKPDSGKNAVTAFLTAPKLENHHQLLEEQAAKVDGTVSLWADAGLLALSARKSGSPESRELSQVALDRGWGVPKRRVQILNAIEATGFHGLDDQVRAAMDAPDAAVAEAAKKAAKTLKLEKKGQDKTPLVSTLKPDEVVAAVLTTRGDVDLGKQLLTCQSCTTCHASSLEEPQKGPYLGNIAKTYSRGNLAESILDPGKTIAQGFATELFTLSEGPPQMGFVTFESADQVKARNIAGQEFTWKTAEIVRRDKLPNSLMPPGLASNLTIREFASLLDYLESLSGK